MPRYATVVVDISVDKKFDYLIPPELVESAVPGVRVRVPFRSGARSAYVVAVRDGERRRGARAIISVRDREPVVSAALLRLADWISSYYCCPLPAAIRCIVPSGVRKGRRSKTPLFVRPIPGAGGGEEGLERLASKAPVQARALKALLDGGGPVLVSELAGKTGASRDSIRSLEKKGLVEIFRERVFRDPWEGGAAGVESSLPPTPEQARAIAHLVKLLDGNEFAITLLHGVTGSGKTEVYMQAIDEALKRGRGAIVLVPEISLTPQTVGMFKARFSEKVAVLHSRLGEGERLDEWDRLKTRRARVVVGARSAVFAPVPDLGLIVVDEEHERSYKQEDSPRYHARDVAVARGRIEGAAVILGSATPSVESFSKAAAGGYGLFTLSRRIENRRLPEITIVDMKEENRRSGRMNFFSRRLITAMEARLEKGEQVILFLNRRGYSPVVICGKCGHVQNCPHCSVSLTLHMASRKMLCHLCGAEHKPLRRCPRCGSKSLRLLGAGTQRLESMISKFFPEYRVGRMDSDSMVGKGVHARILGEFTRGEIQILLGTQMIAKGLHVPNVTLVGVISADTALNLPDFRASEQTFQLLTQVSGRAGRGDVPGEVIVQTYAPRHPAIIAARDGDYEAFYRRELAFREELGYPPAKRLVLVTLRGRNEQAVKWFSGQYSKMLAAQAPRGMETLGPAPSPIARVRGYYRWQLVCKGGNGREVNEALKAVSTGLRAGKNIQILVDVDPVSML